MSAESSTPRKSALAVFLKLVGTFGCATGLYLVFFAGEVFGGATTIWMGGMMFALSEMVDAV